MSYICSKIFEKKKKFKSGSEIPPEFFFFFDFNLLVSPSSSHCISITFRIFVSGGGEEGGASVRVLVDSLLNT